MLTVTRRAALRLLIVEPVRRAALVVRNAFTAIGGSELELLIHLFAPPRFAAG